MPTTRSSRRSSETFQALEPPTRSRKIQPVPSPVPIAQVSIPRTFPKPKESPPTSPILEAIKAVSRYKDAATQTDDIVMLTPKEKADSEEQAASKTPQKRIREDDSEDDHRSKRVMHTPQPKPDNTYWMFGSATSARVPRTAPARSLGASSFRRPRGLNSRTPQHHRRQGANSESVKVPQLIAPVQVDDTEPEPSSDHKGVGADHIQEETTQPSTPTPKPAQSSLFGSMRGLAATGLHFFSNLSPRRSSAQEPSPPSTKSQPQSSARQPIVENDDEEMTPTQRQYPPRESDDESDTATGSPAAAHQQRQPPTVPGIYDHLHIYTADNLPKGKLMYPPRAPTPPDPLELMKETHPNIPEAQLRRIVEKRQRAREERERETGIPANPQPIVKAPLFGPDSHYARGTVDPSNFLVKPLCMYSREELTTGSKRKYDAVDNPTPGDVVSSKHDAVVDTTPEDVMSSESAQDGAAAAPGFTEDNAVDTEDTLLETPTIKRQRTEPPPPPPTPRSAMKKGGNFNSSISKRSVQFNTNPISESRDLHPHYGPAGQYRGSTFADKSPDDRQDDSTLSSLDYSDVISPSTRLNTIANTNVPTGYDAMIQLEKNLGANIPEIDFSARDPNDPKWRPSVSNPRPGSFRVPFLDEEDEDMDADEQEDSSQVTTTENTPAQPSTPRMSHAELPGPPLSVASSVNPDSILFESTELAIEKARSAAQKYKPRDSSRLSEVSQAISRSPSPDTHDHESTESRPRTTAPAVKPLGAPPQAFVPPTLDNTIVGDDGMTDHAREHQYDDWAANLDWPSPQTYEEAGTCTAEIGELIRKNWSKEDDRRSEEFWHREFEMIEREQIEALGKGKVLQFITGMEDAFMDGVAV